MWINPKLNWTKDDFYNAEDLNRVENNTQDIANRLIALQYIMPIGSVKTNRTYLDIDLISSINRIEQNIEIIRNNFLVPPGWLERKVWVFPNKFSYEDANRLESNLDKLNRYIGIAKENLIYCGTFSCGTDWEGGLY